MKSLTKTIQCKHDIYRYYLLLAVCLCIVYQYNYAVVSFGRDYLIQIGGGATLTVLISNAEGQQFSVRYFYFCKV